MKDDDLNKDDSEDPDAAEDAGEDGEEHEELFGFLRPDREWVGELAPLARKLVARPSLTAKDICLLGKLIFALERLPRPTPGVAVRLTLSHHLQRDLSYQSLALNELGFRMDEGASLTHVKAERERFNETVFYVEAGGDREQGEEEDAPPARQDDAIEDWLASFRRRVEFPSEMIHLEELGEDQDIDWNEKPDDSVWDQLSE